MRAVPGLSSIMIRVGTTVALVGTASAMAACGGDGADGTTLPATATTGRTAAAAPSIDSYGRVFERTCKGFQTATSTFRSRTVSAARILQRDRTAGIQALARAYGDFTGRTAAGFGRLSRADPPPEFEAFQRRIDRQAAVVVPTFRRIRTASRRVRTEADLERIVALLDAAKSGDAVVRYPQELQARAPSCFGTRTSAPGNQIS